MLRSYSPKRINAYFSNINNLFSYNNNNKDKDKDKSINKIGNISSNKNIIHNGSQQILPSSIKKIKQNPYHQQFHYQYPKQKKYMTNKLLKNSYKQIHHLNHHNQSKYDFKNKYLFNHNHTAYGSPYQKSLSPSYISTPNQKSFNNNTLQQLKNLSVTTGDFKMMMPVNNNSNNDNNQNKSMKNLKKLVKKDSYQFLPTQEQNLQMENCNGDIIKVNFIINQNKFGCQISKNKLKSNHKNQGHLEKSNSKSKISLKIIQKSYTNSSSFSLMRQEFLKDFSCVSDQIKNHFHGFIGFQTIPYSFSLTQKINSDQKCTFQWLIQNRIRQISLSPIYIQKQINYSNIQFKDFQILQHLGSGGFSTVYLGKNKLNGQLSALKLIKKNSITTPKKIKMLQNQKNILFNINHPNLVQLYYAFESNSYVIFGLQYCSNGNLYSFLQKKKNLTQDQAKYVFRQILKGVDYLHQKNILFRDIKLQNILFDSLGNIKITDFGLSKPNVNDQQITYSYCGSPQYMAPQMLTKQGHSFEVDYYALGILLYELLFGRSPFYAAKKEDIFSGIMNDEVTFPKNLIVSKQVKALIKGLLQKNPKRRIGSLKGIKQIRSHPWLRLNNNQKQNQNENPFTFKTSYESQQISPLDKKKIKQLFQTQIDNLTLQNEKYFFGDSFINEDYLKKIESNTHVFSHQQCRMKKTKKIKQVQNTQASNNHNYNHFNSISKIKMKNKKMI